MSSQQRYRVAPGGSLGGELIVPGDKSISHRALLLNALAEGAAQVTGLLEGEDCMATATALRAMGVAIDRTSPGSYSIRGAGRRGLRKPAAPLDLGNSGTGMRLLAGALAGQVFDCVLTGDSSLRQRPMGRIAKPLALMGGSVATQDGCPPLSIAGCETLTGIDYAIPVASAQVKSAILLAGLNAQGTTQVHSPGPSRDHTERLMEAMGAPISSSADTVSLDGPADLAAIDIEVPADFSSAAFFLLAGSFAARESLWLRGVGVNPTRIGLLTILEQMGAKLRQHNLRSVGGEPVADIEVRRAPLRGISVAPELVPLAIDEFPVVFVAAAAAEGVSEITAADELRHKESDRISVMCEGLRQLGVEVEERPDGAVIHGKPGGFDAASIDSAGDHRIAMAFVVAALLANGPVEIQNTANVATSFPGFPQLAHEAGFQLEIIGDA